MRDFPATEMLKSAARNASRYLGVNRISRRYVRRKVLVLCYHGVVAEPQKDRFWYANTVSLQEFEHHLDSLAHWFHPVSASELLAWCENGRDLPDNPVAVTFDDGYRNNLMLAASALKKRGIPCIFHLATGYIGTDRMLWTDELVSRIIAWPEHSAPGPDGNLMPIPQDIAERRALGRRWKEDCKRIAWSRVEQYLERLRQTPVELNANQELFGFLSWEEVRELRRQGFDIGAHTVNHPILTQLPPDGVTAELTESKLVIERETGEPCVSIAYPNGGPADFSDTVIRETSNAGYRLGFTTIERFNAAATNPLALNRVCIMGHLHFSAFAFRVSGVPYLLACH